MLQKILQQRLQNREGRIGNRNNRFTISKRSIRAIKATNHRTQSDESRENLFRCFNLRLQRSQNQIRQLGPLLGVIQLHHHAQCIFQQVSYGQNIRHQSIQNQSSQSSLLLLRNGRIVLAYLTIHAESITMTNNMLELRRCGSTKGRIVSAIRHCFQQQYRIARHVCIL